MAADHGPSPALLEAVVRSATDAIVAVDTDQRIVLFNAASEAMFRCSAVEAIGSPLNRFLPDRYHGAHERDVAAFARTGATSRAMGHLRPLAARRADGEEFPIEATISRAEVEGAIYLTAIVRDVTHLRRIEAELRRRAELLDNAHDAVLAWAWDGPITYWNRGAERLYGYSADEVRGQLSAALLHIPPADVARARHALEVTGRWEAEQTHTTRRGEHLLIETRQTLVRDASRTYVLEANRDVTAHRLAERERAESVARESAARFQADVSAALAGSLCYEASLRRLSEVVAQRFGDSCVIDILDGDSWRRVAVARLDQGIQALVHGSAGSATPAEFVAAFEGALPNADEPLWFDQTSEIGSVALCSPVDGHCSAILAPLRVRGRLLGCLTIVSSRSDRPLSAADARHVQVVAERAAMAIENGRLHEQIDGAKRLAEQQLDRLRAILDNLPTAVILLAQPDGSVALANAAATSLILGPTFADGPRLDSLDQFALHQMDGSPVARNMRPGIRALGGTKVRNEQLLLTSAEGLRIPVLIQATPLDGAGESDAGALLVVQDITRLREAEQLKDDFLALVSHEFRTPLTAIHGGAQLLATSASKLDATTQADLIADVVNESARLDQLLTNMLSLADILAGRLEASTEPVLVEPMVRAAVRELERRGDRHTFAIELAPALPPVEADPGLCSQIMRNLLENAIKYSPEGGRVRVVASTEGDTVRIDVSDQGIGIAPEYVDTVFERFRRVGANPTVRGMGLGLYLVRNLVEAQGGLVYAESPGVGKGATFTVELPCARE